MIPRGSALPRLFRLPGVHQEFLRPKYPVASSLPIGFLARMARKFSAIPEEARALPYGERTELIERLIADSAKDIDPEIEKAWGDEALRRLKEIEAGKAGGVPLDEALARMRKTVGL